jgi:hypothetical protein
MRAALGDKTLSDPAAAADAAWAASDTLQMVPPPDAEAEADDWRVELVGRITTVSGFAKLLTGVIEFGANAEGAAVLAAMAALPEVLNYRSRQPPASLVPGTMIDPQVVPGPWKRLVFGHPARSDGTVDRNGYTFCVLEQFYRHLKRREIYADASTKWRNPQAHPCSSPSAPSPLSSTATTSAKTAVPVRLTS